jgi:hypothetical protein
MRYHGLGSDFSARSDLIDPDHKHRNDDDGGDQFPAMEKKPELNWVDVENIMDLLNVGQYTGRNRRKRF